VSKLVSDWFPAEQGAIATGVATMGMFIGMAGAMAATPPLAATLGMRGAMAVFAAIAVASGALFVALCRERHAGTGPTTAGRMRELMTRDLLLVFGISFVGLGYFNGLTTWLEELVAPNGLDAVAAGALGGVLIVAGIVGAAVIPALSDRVRRRKPFVIGCAAAALALTIPMCSLDNYPTVLALGAALGFCFLPAYALLLEMSVELAGAGAAGLATGMLMLTGNAGAVVVVVLVPIAQPHGPLLLAGMLAIAVVLAALVRETAKPRPA
jgi:cyanate permease